MRLREPQPAQLHVRAHLRGAESEARPVSCDQPVVLVEHGDGDTENPRDGRGDRGHRLVSGRRAGVSAPCSSPIRRRRSLWHSAIASSTLLTDASIRPAGSTRSGSPRPAGGDEVLRGRIHAPSGLTPKALTSASANRPARRRTSSPLSGWAFERAQASRAAAHQVARVEHRHRVDPALEAQPAGDEPGTRSGVSRKALPSVSASIGAPPGSVVSCTSRMSQGRGRRTAPTVVCAGGERS